MYLDQAVKEVFREFCQEHTTQLIDIVKEAAETIAEQSKPEKIYNKTEAAKFLRMATSTFNDLVKDGLLPLSTIAGKQRYPESLLMSLFKVLYKGQRAQSSATINRQKARFTRPDYAFNPMA